MTERAPPAARALIEGLGLAPHPEGGHYRQIYRSPHAVDPRDGRPLRPALTTIDFVLARGEHSAWHRVRSDEVWHLLEGGPLLLWLAPPALDRVERVELGPPCRRHVVPADWWQAAEPAGEFAYVGATVGPGFDFADFAFGRDEAALARMLDERAPDLRRLL